jgi:excinuclease ABC subunit A
MQFLSDVFIRCPDCNGRRYRAHVLEVKIGATFPDGRRVAWSAADVLDATVDEVIEFFSVFRESKHARRAVNTLKLLQEVGLGYLRLGQPVNTLSGGESQRLKLVRHLADSVTANVSSRLNTSSPKRTEGQPRSHERSHTLFLFDEPTTGLHFDDVRGLLKVFQRLVDSGNSVIVIEHNLDVIKSADWVVDLGPDAGDQGGEIVAQGTPEDIAACERSHTGHSLRRVLEQAVEMKGIP